jgi:hypothetical protein
MALLRHGVRLLFAGVGLLFTSLHSWCKMRFRQKIDKLGYPAFDISSDGLNATETLK